MSRRAVGGCPSSDLNRAIASSDGGVAFDKRAEGLGDRSNGSVANAPRGEAVGGLALNRSREPPALLDYRASWGPSHVSRSEHFPLSFLPSRRPA